MEGVTGAVESLYTDKCSVYIYEPYKVGNLTKHREKTVYTDIPCRLSFSSAPKNLTGNIVATTEQTIKLFLNPDYSIPSGSKITVRHLGAETEYSSSGQPKTYASHQEIELELFRRRA